LPETQVSISEQANSDLQSSKSPQKEVVW